MTASYPTIVALDFDGVICDGLIEYFQTAWHTYCKVWSPLETAPPKEITASFYRLRPVIETGWEMPVLIRALMLQVPETEILQEWRSLATQLLQQSNLVGAEIAQQLDQFRDQWITSDLDGWLSLHRFYPGVIERLRALIDSPVQPIIITTKEGRFVSQLLQQQHIQLSEQWIFGKESQRPKHQVLRELIAQAAEMPIAIWFVEDRLKTLELVQQQTDLDDVKLFLADWGYNTATEREAARQAPQIALLSLSQFAQDFSAWS